MVINKPSSLVKPTLDTKFHIDYDWWKREPTGAQDLRIYLLSHLLPEQRERLSQSAEGTVVDYVHPDTAEVFQLDELGLAIQTAASDPNFINPHTSLVDSVFRVFLANGNVPLSPRELAEKTGRSATVILKTLSGGRVYNGIRPHLT
jgi:hypothetical protein